MIPDDQVRLTELSPAAGCAAKIGPGTLAGVLDKLPKFQDPNLLVGIETSDDGAVYKINEELALIQTLDFFPPMVDDPYTFGQIAAANALSDIYAMGGEPKTALNIVAWPNCVNPEFLGDILRGGAEKVKEAGAVLAGGHSIQDDVPKYGLSVTGFVHPARLLKNSGARPGDVLILTKPLGIGIVNTAMKAQLASAEAQRQVIHTMTTLNRAAKQVFDHFTVHACTDITGFGLVGHSLEMAEGSGATLVIETAKLPLIDEAISYAEMGLIPEGAYRNRTYAGAKVDLSDVIEPLADICFDPQTSGGLMVSVPADLAAAVLAGFQKAGLETAAAVIGYVTEKQERSVRLI